MRIYVDFDDCLCETGRAFSELVLEMFDKRVPYDQQVDVYAERMTDGEMALFCIAGAVATLFAGIVLAALAGKISHKKCKLLRAVMYYITVAFLLLDPLYLSILCGFFGGGDMNGIRLLCPEWIARSVFAGLLIVNAWVFWKRVLPVYRESFSNEAGI